MALNLKHLGGDEWIEQINAAFDLINAATLTTPTASNAETVAGSLSSKAVTPASLAYAFLNLLASTSAFGTVKLASSAQAIAGTDTANAVTSAALAALVAKMTPASFVGHSGAGACTLTGANVGDTVIFVTGVASTTVGNQSAGFETTISIANQIQQSSASNLSANVYLAFLARKS